MSASRDPEEVLASIRRLVAREVSDAKDREAQERPARDSMPVISSRASAAARLVLGADDQLAANGDSAEQASPSGDASAPAEGATGAPQSQGTPAEVSAGSDAAQATGSASPTEEYLRTLIRDILHEEVRTVIGPRINENIRRIVQEELAQLFTDEKS